MAAEKVGHTNGPWIVNGSVHVIATGPNGANICSVSDPRVSKYVGYSPVEIDSPDFDEACNNARWIVACVNGCEGIVDPSAVRDMLAALNACLDYIPCSEVRNWPPGFKLKEKALSLARAAIAKATGADQ